MPIPYNLECTTVVLQSLHALFQLLTTGGTLMYCPQASDFAKALGTAARHDNGHIVSLASSLALALRSGRSTLAVAGVFGAGKTRSLTFLLAWLALTTHLKSSAQRESCGWSHHQATYCFELKPDHQRYFIRPVGRRQKPTLPARPMTCEPVRQPHTSQAAVSSSSPRGQSGIKKGRPTPLLTRIWKM